MQMKKNDPIASDVVSLSLSLFLCPLLCLTGMRPTVEKEANIILITPQLTTSAYTQVTKLRQIFGFKNGVSVYTQVGLYAIRAYIQQLKPFKVQT